MARSFRPTWLLPLSMARPSAGCHHMADRNCLRRWLRAAAHFVERRADAHRRDRSTRCFRHQQTARADAGAGRRAHLEARRDDLGGDPQARGHSAANFTISGFAARDNASPSRAGSMQLQVSTDPVGAPIFYRDVPLMPSETGEGIHQAARTSAIPLIAWRMRNVAETGSHVVMTDLHTCANCHSFSARWQDAGHGPGRPAERQGPLRAGAGWQKMTIRNEDVISWTSFPGENRQPASRGLHVPGLARWPPRGHHHPAARHQGLAVLLRRQFQGLPLPAGLLSHARHPGLV